MKSSVINDVPIVTPDNFVANFLLLQEIFSATEKQYVELLNFKKKDSKEEDKKPAEEAKAVSPSVTEPGLYYIDPAILREIDEVRKDKRKISYVEILELYLIWNTRWSTLVAINAEHYKKSKVIKAHVDDVSSLLIVITKGAIKLIETHIANKVIGSEQGEST